MSESQVPDQLQVVVRRPYPEEQWAFCSPYVEFVWSEKVGPIALLLARRLGALIEESPNGAEISVADLAAELCVGPPRIHDGLNRLHRPGLVSYSAEHGVVGTSGFAASVGEKGRSALSPRGLETHDRLSAECGGESWVQRRARRVERLGESLPGRRSGPSLAFGGSAR